MNKPNTIIYSALVTGLLLSSCSKSGGSSGGPSVGVAEDLRFDSRMEIPAGVQDPGLRSFVLGDFNADGKLDIVISAVGAKDQTLRILVGQDGKGGFSDQALFSAPFAEPPGEIAAGDFDKDGDLDLAIQFVSQGVIRVYRNTGSGTFVADKGSLAAGTNGTGLMAGDLNGDGRADLVSGKGRGRILQVHLADAQGQFGKAIELDGGAGANLGPATMADLDLSGRKDLAVVDMDQDRVLVFYSEKAGGFNSVPLVLDIKADGPVHVLAEDYNRDGRPDLLVADYFSNQLSYFQGLGASGFATPQVSTLDTNPFHLSSGDLDKDGNLDLVIAHWPGYSVGVRYGDGKGGFTPERNFVTSGQPSKSAVVDLDQDGMVDVLCSATHSKAMSWFRGRDVEPGMGRSGPHSPERFSSRIGLPVPKEMAVLRFTAAADFDMDGFADAAYTDPSVGVLTVMAGAKDGRLHPAGTAGQALEISVGKAPGSLSRSDFDRDGKMDLVVAVEGGLRFLINKSTTGNIVFDTFPPLSQPPFAAGTGAVEVKVGKVDGDEIEDLVLSDYAGNQIFVLQGTKQGFNFTKLYTPISVPGGPLGLVLGDFDADGKLDIAVSRFRLASVRVLKGKGDGTFSVMADLAAGSRPNYLRSADFNGDGLQDLVVSNLDANTLGIYMNSVTGFRPARSLQVGSAPTALFAGDLNKDGKADILVSNSESADFYFLLGDGVGTFVSTRKFAGNYQGISADLGDVNGDGKLDLVVSSGSNLVPGLSLFLNRSTLK